MSYLKLLPILLATVFCAPCCQKQSTQLQVTLQEKAWLEPFFKELFLRDSAIYTLWGDKPITEAVLYYYSDEEIKNWYNCLSEEEKKDCFAIEASDLERHWDQWEKFQDQLQIKDYLLFKKVDPDDPKVAFVYVVNIFQTASILRKHYNTFYEIVGKDFDPEEIACDFKNKDSFFWKKAWHHPVSIGILFGFGEENAWNFYTKHYDFFNDISDDYQEFSHTIFLKCTEDRNYYSCSLTSFPLPAFVVPEGNNLMVEKYKEERKEIQKIYESQDFVELTLKKLTGKAIQTLD